MIYPTPSAQEVFDTVVTHLFTQGQPAINSNGNCCFWDEPTGRMCAAGVLIPERFRSPLYDKLDLSAYGLITKLRTEKIIDLSNYVDLIYDLQNAHDHPSQWLSNNYHFNKAALANKLREIAQKFSLSDASVAEMRPETGSS